MADDKKGDSNIQLGFMSTVFADDPNALQLIGVHGRETVSTLFEYELLLKKTGTPLTDHELEDLVKAPCAIALGAQIGDVVHGMLVRIEHLDATRFIEPRYLARMVPQVYLLTMGRRSAIYQNMTIPEMAEAILASYGLKSGTQFEILITNSAKSPKREYIVQYQESDWDFICRWLEHEGYFYWFRHGKKGATLVIADANDDATTIAEPTTVSYRERNNLSTGGASTIFDFRVVQQRIPAKVTVVDYNYRRPADMLIATQKVADSGFGHVFSYGDHCKDLDAGKAVAKLRAERFLATQRTINGSTDCSRFRVGHSFELENHHHSDYDGKYLITGLDLKVGHDVDNARASSTASVSETIHVFTCRFEALPLAVQFRPPRTTAWPKITAYTSGHVEADGSGDYAQIDDQGRYKVKMSFDTGTVAGGPASRWIRMAQNYAGAGYGTHFPLHKGTEVLIAHSDGDPDRPMIIGAVPNPHTVTTVTSSNASQSVVQTASGMRIEFEDLQS